MMMMISLILIVILLNLDYTESLTPSEALHLNVFDNFTTLSEKSNLHKAVLRWTNPDYESVFYKISNIVRFTSFLFLQFINLQLLTYYLTRIHFLSLSLSHTLTHTHTDSFFYKISNVVILISF